LPFNSASDAFELHPDVASYGTTLKDQNSPSAQTYLVVDSVTQRLEVHAPLHVQNTSIEALDNAAVGLQITADQNNPMVVFDTRGKREIELSGKRDRRDGRVRDERERRVRRGGERGDRGGVSGGEEDVLDGCGAVSRFLLGFFSVSNLFSLFFSRALCFSRSATTDGRRTTRPVPSDPIRSDPIPHSRARREPRTNAKIISY
jgi:hypothetical protein